MKQKKPKSKAALTEYIYVQNCNIFMFRTVIYLCSELQNIYVQNCNIFMFRTAIYLQ